MLPVLRHGALTPLILLLAVLPSPAQLAPAAAFPGDWLQFRGDRKLTGRSRLAGHIAPPRISSTAVGIPRRDTLPSVSFSSANVTLYTVYNTVVNVVVQRADVSIQNIRASDGYTLPSFGFYFTHPIGTSAITLGFDTADPDLKNIPGFTQSAFFNVDTSARTVSASNLSSLPTPLQHLIYALAANLTSVFQNAATRVNASPGAPGLPVWTIGDVSASAASFTDLFFQPGPTLWSLFIGARQTSIAFQASGAAAGTISLPAADSNAGLLASNATWGIGPQAYDLNRNGQPISFPVNSAAKIGAFDAGSNDAGSNGFQKVEFDSAFSSCGNNANTCFEYGHLYQWQNGNWVERWITPPIPALFSAQTIVGDFDGDGRLEVAVEPWDDMQVYDLLTGQMKTSAQFKPKDAESGRGYGWSGAFDLDGSGKQELIALGTFQNFIAVMGWKDGQLVKLWDHLIEASVEARQTVHVEGPFPVQDIDGDGRFEIVTSIYNETGDGEWHIVARDGMTGTVVLDQPRRFLLGMADVNGDGSPEMFTVATSGLATPAYGQIDVVSFRGRTLVTLLELNGVALETQPVQSLPLNVNTSDQLSTVVMGPVLKAGLPVFFTRRLMDQLAGTIEVTAWQWAKGSLAQIATITGPNLQVVATRPAAAGAPGFLIRATVRGAGAGSMVSNGVSGTVVQSGLIPAPLSSAVVGHLRPSDPPAVIVQNALEELVAFRPSAITGVGTVLWNHPGRGGAMGSDSNTGQFGFSGPLLASLTGDGTLQTIAATRGPAGQARVVAIQPDGTDLWTADFDQFPGAPPPWNEPGVTLFFAGRFREPDREDVAVATRRGASGSEELNLLDGSTGALVWNDIHGNTPGSSFNQRGAGQGQMAVYDWNGDGLDEIVNFQTDVFWVKDGNDRNLIDRVFAYSNDAVFGNLPVYYGVPAVADFLNNGTDTILYGASTYMLGLMNSRAAIWQGGFQAGTPAFLQGIADLDGDGTLSVVSAGVPGDDGQSTLTVLRGSTGERLWSIPLPGCGHFLPNQNWTGNAPTPVTAGDINGDGRDEAVFACGTKIYVVGADPGNQSGKILWTLDMGTALNTPILADPEGKGLLEIIVVGANGYIYGIG